MPVKDSKKISSRDKRRVRIRKKVRGTAERPRLAVYRSLRHVYAQLIDDTAGATLTIVSTQTDSVIEQLKEHKSKTEAAKIVGKELARLAKERNITSVTFDRGGYLYHGRVKAVADGAREGGLVF
jgi:large subunit ribosomal protein L18